MRFLFQHPGLLLELAEEHCFFFDTAVFVSPGRRDGATAATAAAAASSSSSCCRWCGRGLWSVGFPLPCPPHRPALWVERSLGVRICTARARAGEDVRNGDNGEGGEEGAGEEGGRGG